MTTATIVMGGALTTPRTAVIAMVNQSTVIDDTQGQQITAALQRHFDGEFAAAWGLSTQLVYVGKGSTPPAGCWQNHWRDTSDIQGAGGYHMLSASGYPVGMSFVKTAMLFGMSPSGVICHESDEMRVDPLAAVAYQVGDSTFWAFETDDMVEADADGYTIDGVHMSDFATPAWFTGIGHGPYDFKRRLAGPRQLRPGGYVAQWTPQTGWTQVFAETIPSARLVQLIHDPGSRFMARKGRQG